jgi:hypothetical protein
MYLMVEVDQNLSQGQKRKLGKLAMDITVKKIFMVL